MRLVTYVREFPPVADVEPAFAQGERLRSWATEHGHQIVAECRDAVDADEGTGFAAALAIVDRGLVEAVAIASVRILGDDVFDQEIRLWEIQRRDISLLSTSRGDDDILGDTDDAARQTARTVLARLHRHRTD